MTKLCSLCGIIKDHSEFYADSRVKDGLTSVCKECHKIRAKAYRDTPEAREKMRVAQARFFKKNPDYNKTYYEEHKEYFAEHNHEYYLENTEYFRQAQEDFLEKNPNYHKEHRLGRLDEEKESRARFKEKRPTYARDYTAKRCAEDVVFKLCRNLRGRLYKALKGQAKEAHTLDLMGCTTNELNIYLESKFQPGMTWDNWTVDGWHVDHIIPLVAFDLENPEELRKACHYTNLQPLWAKENLSKGGKILKVKENTPKVIPHTTD